MARIRTVKPEIAAHGDLYDLEVETGLPIRFAWVMLFTQCDREGRFKWSPRELKLGVLPHDPIDFSRVLHALATRGFLVKYEANGKVFGVIPTFTEHQTINNKESASKIPDPKNRASQVLVDIEGKYGTPTREERDDHALTTREPRDDHVSQGERKGRERKGKEYIIPIPSLSHDDDEPETGEEPSLPLPDEELTPRQRGENPRALGTNPRAKGTNPREEDEHFEAFWKAYPSRGSSDNPKTPARKKFSRKVLAGTPPAEIIEGARSYADAVEATGKIGTEFVCQAQTWLNQERWRDYADGGGAEEPLTSEEQAAYDAWVAKNGGGVKTG